MNTAPIYLEAEETQRLLTCGNNDAVALYLYLRNGNTIHTAGTDLRLPDERLQPALQALRTQSLYKLQTSEIPKMTYKENDVITAVHQDMDFKALCQEVQYRLGKPLNTEELKILLNMTNYLGMPNDVVCVLISYCVSRARQRGALKVPSMWAIEKEAYRWSDAGIDSQEAAIAYMHQQGDQHTRMGKLMEILQIRGRNLTTPEEKYAQSWLQMGMSEEMLRLAYEKTCSNTGGMNWRYMNKVLTVWKQEGYHSPADVKSRGRTQRVPTGSGELGEAEIEAIRKMMNTDIDDFLNPPSCRTY